MEKIIKRKDILLLIFVLPILIIWINVKFYFEVNEVFELLMGLFLSSAFLIYSIFVLLNIEVKTNWDVVLFLVSFMFAMIGFTVFMYWSIADIIELKTVVTSVFLLTTLETVLRFGKA